MKCLITKNIVQDEITDQISKNFDYKFEGNCEAFIPDFDLQDKEFGIGLIVGPSGSGKSTLLNGFGEGKTPLWDSNKAIVSHFDSAHEAQERLSAVGLNSVPAWFRPYHVLSTGEKYRADLARTIGQGAVIDEFTSVVDRSVARSCASALSRYIKGSGFNSVVFASCHYDIIDWLQPDWVFDTMTEQFVRRGLLCRPKIEIQLVPCGAEAWSTFSKHHYLSGNLNKSAKNWLCTWGSEAVGEIHISEGKRYFSKTTHPRMGGYRNASSKWRATSKNMLKRSDASCKTRWVLRDVYSYSHEYLG